MSFLSATTKKRIHTALLWVWNQEISILLLLFSAAALFFGFAELADEVFEGETRQFDRALLLVMRNSQNPADLLGPPWLEQVGRDITAMGGNAQLTLLTLAVLGFLILTKRKYLAIVVIVATLGALTLSTTLKHSFDRPRPDIVPHQTTVYTASFPSGHSMLSASTYLTLGALLARTQRRRRIKIYLLGVAATATFLVGVSRVYLGVHWPTDVLAGWTAGAGWAILCWLLAVWLQSRGQPTDTTHP